MKKWQSILSIIGGLILLSGTILGADKYVAHQKDLMMLTQNFEQYKVDQRLDSIQDRIWQVEDRIKKEGEKGELIERLRELKAEQSKMLLRQQSN